MDIIQIPNEYLSFLSSLNKDYGNDEPFLHQFYGNRPNLEGLQKQTLQKTLSPSQRMLLAEELEMQYSHFPKHAEVSKNINLLKEQNTFTVTTGQQLHIYLGPLYVYWKIISTIVTCRILQQNQPEKNFVPIFWLAGEDHDFEEISELQIDEIKFNWENKPAKPAATGRLSTSGLSEIGEALDKHFSTDISWKKYSEVFKRVYQPTNTLAKATTEVLNELFGHLGLVILDADSKTLKSSFVHVIKSDILHNQIEPLIEQQSLSLEQKYKRQLKIKGLNHFYLLDGSREKIVKSKAVYKLASGKTLGDSAWMQNEIEIFPERFSPNAALRPLYQETILPNIAYVGGPAEIAYWMQLNSVFDHFSQEFPVLLARKHMFVLEFKHIQKLKKMKISPETLLLDEVSFEKVFNKSIGFTEINLNQEIEQLAATRKEILDKIASIGAFSIREYAKHTATNIRLLKKANKQLKQAQQQRFKQKKAKVLEIKHTLLKKNYLQERNVFIPTFMTQLNPELIVAELSQDKFFNESCYVLVL